MTGKDIASYSLAELTGELGNMGEKPYRARQIYAWIHARGAEDFGEMTDISRLLRERLSGEYEIAAMKPAARQISKKDGTEKFLFELWDGNQVESVLMRYSYGNSVCISSQAGCRMGCRFCASAIGGLKRSLTPSEMLRQIYQIQRITGERVSNVAVMGTGEPLDNYENLVKFLHMLSDENGLHISQRNITVSTCGIVPNMRKLAEEGLQITLALSLHAPSQEKRRRLMPIAEQYGLLEVMEACGDYFKKTGRRVTYEYSLMAGINDTEEDAQMLAGHLGHRNCHVNLIPLNPVAERGFHRPTSKKTLEFKNKLEKTGINVTIRKEKGSDIDGACGQLRRRCACAKRER